MFTKVRHCGPLQSHFWLPMLMYGPVVDLGLSAITISISTLSADQSQPPKHCKANSLFSLRFRTTTLLDITNFLFHGEDHTTRITPSNIGQKCPVIQAIARYYRNIIRNRWVIASCPLLLWHRKRKEKTTDRTQPCGVDHEKLVACCSPGRIHCQ